MPYISLEEREWPPTSTTSLSNRPTEASKRSSIASDTKRNCSKSKTPSALRRWRHGGVQSKAAKKSLLSVTADSQSKVHEAGRAFPRGCFGLTAHLAE